MLLTWGFLLECMRAYLVNCMKIAQMSRNQLQWAYDSYPRLYERAFQLKVSFTLWTKSPWKGKLLVNWPSHEKRANFYLTRGFLVECVCHISWTKWRVHEHTFMSKAISQYLVNYLQAWSVLYHQGRNANGRGWKTREKEKCLRTIMNCSSCYLPCLPPIATNGRPRDTILWLWYAKLL